MIENDDVKEMLTAALGRFEVELKIECQWHSIDDSMTDDEKVRETDRHTKAVAWYERMIRTAKHLDHVPDFSFMTPEWLERKNAIAPEPPEGLSAGIPDFTTETK